MSQKFCFKDQLVGKEVFFIYCLCKDSPAWRDDFRD